MTKAKHVGTEIHLKPSLGVRLRTWFFAGILVTAPIAITLLVAWTIIEFIDGQMTALLPPQLRGFAVIPGVGVIFLVVMITVIGMFTTGILGRMLVRLGEQMVNKVPIVRNIHGALKQIIETVLAQQSSAFRQVVLVEYPRRGMWAIAFITGVTEGEVQNLTSEECINVFLPTTPNPTSGFLLFVPRRDLVVLSMTVEEGIKMVISGGIVTPPDRRSEDIKKMPLVTVTEESGERDAVSEKGFSAPGSNPPSVS